MLSSGNRIGKISSSEQEFQSEFLFKESIKMKSLLYGLTPLTGIVVVIGSIVIAI